MFGGRLHGQSLPVQLTLFSHTNFAIWGNCAVYSPSLLIAFTRTLDIIRQAAERANHRSTFLSEAFTGLLAGHLPAKYAWQGILGSKDRINKGCFYDAGKVTKCCMRCVKTCQVNTSDPLPVLKQLAVEPINSKRPCIYVNT